MSDFLTRLAQRQLGQSASVEPRVRELYAPVSAALPLSIIDTAAEKSLTTTTRISEAPGPLVTGAGALTHPAAAPLTDRQREASRESSAEQGAETDSDQEKSSGLAAEGVRADYPALAMQNASLESRDAAVSAPARVVTEIENPGPLPTRQESRAAREPTPRETPQRLVNDRVTSAAAAPPRLGLKESARAPAPALERAPADSEPAVQVTIGRIEVTAVTAAPAPRRAASPRPAAMSLDDYLARRQRRES